MIDKVDTKGGKERKNINKTKGRYKYHETLTKFIELIYITAIN